MPGSSRRSHVLLWGLALALVVLASLSVALAASQPPAPQAPPLIAPTGHLDQSAQLSSSDVPAPMGAPATRAAPGPIEWQGFELGNQFPVPAFAPAAAFTDDGQYFIDVAGGEGYCGHYCNLTWEVNLDNPSGPNWVTLGAPWRNGTLGSSLVWDAASSQLVFFGGLNGTFGALNATWVLTPFLVGWAPIPSGPAPSPRWSSAVAYDPALGGIVLFGGVGDRGQLNADTWLFRGDRWTLLEPALSPPARSGASLVWQTDEDRLVLFGGNGSAGPMGDTWAFSGTTWYPLHPPTSPPPRADASASTDLEGDLVLFGGNETAQLGNDTWILSGDNWTEAANVGMDGAPGSVQGATLVPDQESTSSVLFLIGGEGPTGTLAQLWLMNVENGGVVPPPLPVRVVARAVPFAGTAPMNVSLSAFGEDGTPPFSYVWNFGDGSPTTDAQATSHTYEQPGLYLADVRAIDSAVPPATGEESVPVLVRSSSTYNVSFSATPQSGGAPLSVSFSPVVNGGTSPYSYHWRFGDGSPTSQETIPSHTYTAPGTYVTRLWVNDSQGRSAMWASTILAGGVGLTVSLSSVPTTGSIPLRVELHASPSGGPAPYRFLWTFGDGNSSSGTSANATQWYNHTGSYDVNITVIDAFGEEASTSLVIVALPPPPPPPPPFSERVAEAVVAGVNFLLQPLVLGSIVAVIALLLIGQFAILELPVRRALRRATEPPPWEARWGLAEVAALVAGLRAQESLPSILARLVPLVRRDAHRLAEHLRWEPSPTTVWLARRLLLLIPQLLMAATLLYLGLDLLPATVQQNTPGVHLPSGPLGYLQAWWSYLNSLFSGPFRDPVLAAYLPYTLQLLAVVVALSAVITYPLGLLAGWYRGRVIDQSTRAAGVFSFSVPVFAVTSIVVITGWLWYYTATGGDVLLGSLPSVLWDQNNLGGIPTWIGPLGGTDPTGFVLVDAPLHGAWSLEQVVLLKMLVQGFPIALVCSAILLRYTRLATQEAATETHLVGGRAAGLTDHDLLWNRTSRRVVPMYAAIFGSTFPLILSIQVVAEWAYDDLGLGSAFVLALGTPGATAIGEVAFVMLLMIIVADVVGEAVARARTPSGFARGP